ncbi:MAG: NADH-quinone oxidoreductase subunit H [Eggerthellaceae bacterium]|nr:NADH-quinone oxidoreductase subunit H [Eggerthellaceae bacterium]
MDIVIAIIQAILVLLLAPLASGSTRWLKAKYNTRKGPSIFQDYRDIRKLMHREDLHTKDSSIIHRIAPPIYMGTMFIMALGVPMITRWSPIPLLGDVIVLVYLLTLPRFFFGLSGLDTSDAYASVGSIRELMVSVLVEPAMLLALLVMAVACQTTEIGGIAESVAGLTAAAPVGIIVAAVAFALACYVEMTKIPYDVPDAEQELDEGTMTEYSGPSLAMMKVSLSMKQIIIISWWWAIFIPWTGAWEMGPVALLCGFVMWLALIAVSLFVMAFFENAASRVRYTLMGRQTGIMVVIAAAAFVLCVIGI